MTQKEFFHNFRGFNDTAIYRIIMSKGRSQQHYQLIAMTWMGEKAKLSSYHYCLKSIKIFLFEQATDWFYSARFPANNSVCLSLKMLPKSEISRRICVNEAKKTCSTHRIEVLENPHLLRKISQNFQMMECCPNKNRFWTRVSVANGLWSLTSVYPWRVNYLK